MREIKFRAWDKEYKRMIAVSELSFDYLCDLQTVKNHSGNIFKSNKLELMQFTGLKDKNGKEIYEGDILKFCAKKNEDNFSMGAVYREESGEWRAGKKDGHNFLIKVFSKDLSEVIGNKFDNPELLK